jgi:hypothetical protein
MADKAGFGLDIRCLVNLLSPVGKFDLSLFVIDTNIFYLFLPADVRRDLVNLISGIEHHGVVGTQFYGITQPVSLCHHIFKGSFLLIINIKIGPGGYADQQDQTNPEDQPETEGVVDVKKRTQFCPSLRFSEDASEHISH